MKIEFVKETKPDGTIFYYTLVDNKYDSASMYLEYSQAYEYFVSLKKRQEPIIEILEHYSIDTQNK
jgi:heptaprenylglyceryl phosphate synthase